MEFKELLGRRVYLEIPEEPKSSLSYLDEETKAALEAERMKKFGRLVVYAVGNDITDLQEGDEVMVDPSAVSKVFKIPITPDKEVLMVSYYDIAHIW